MTPDDATREALARAAAGELLGPLEMAAIFRVGRARFHELNQRGAFAKFRVHPAIGPKCFSGVLVHRYVTGEAIYEPTFGRKRRA